MRPPATCAACGQAFLQGERIAVLGSRVYHKSCRRMVERGLANPIAEPTQNEDHWRKQVIDLEQQVHRLRAAAEGHLIAATAAGNRLREMRESKEALRSRVIEIEEHYEVMTNAATARLERIWIEARACQAVGRGIWGWARYLAVHEAAAGVDATVERFRLMELD